MQIKKILVAFVFTTLLVLGGGACSTHLTSVPENSQTLQLWQDARNFQGRGRYELAKQYYELALAGARTVEIQRVLKREIEAVNRILEAQR